MGCDGSKNVQDTKAAPKAAAGRTVVGSQLTSPEDLKSWPQFPEDCKQLTKAALTKEIWDEYGEKSDAKGVSFKQMIFSFVSEHISDNSIFNRMISSKFFS